MFSAYNEKNPENWVLFIVQFKGTDVRSSYNLDP